MLDALADEQILRLSYLLILFTVLGSYALMANNNDWGGVVRGLILWALLFVGVGSAYGLWDEARLAWMMRQNRDGQEIFVERSEHGHFHLNMRVVGNDGVERDMVFMIDTGASETVLRPEDAALLGFLPEDLEFSGVAHTANGDTHYAEVVLPRITIGYDHSIENVPALVTEGHLHASLLGVAFLDRFARIELRRGVMLITF